MSGEPIKMAVQGSEAAGEMLEKLAPASGIKLELTTADLAKKWTPKQVGQELERQVMAQTDDVFFTLVGLRNGLRKLKCVVESLTERKDDNAFLNECGVYYGFPRLLKDPKHCIARPTSVWDKEAVVPKPAGWDKATMITHPLHDVWRRWQLAGGGAEIAEGATWWKFTQCKTLEAWQAEYTRDLELYSLATHLITEYAKRIRTL